MLTCDEFYNCCKGHQFLLISKYKTNVIWHAKKKDHKRHYHHTLPIFSETTKGMNGPRKIIDVTQDFSVNGCLTFERVLSKTGIWIDYQILLD